MKRLLDTNVISDFVRGQQDVMQRLRHHAPGDLVISTISRMEVAYGLARQPARAKRLAPLLDALFDSIEVLGYVEDMRTRPGRSARSWRPSDVRLAFATPCWAARPGRAASWWSLAT